MPRVIEGGLGAQGLRFAVVVSRFNALIGDRLCDGALDALRRSGAREEDLTVIRVPGAYEAPGVARLAAESGEYDAVVCVGAVIRGATPHFDYVAGEAARGIARVAFETSVPVAFGVLTTDTIEQAVERAGAKAGNKGYDAAIGAIELCHVYRALGRVRGRQVARSEK